MSDQAASLRGGTTVCRWIQEKSVLRRLAARSRVHQVSRKAHCRKRRAPSLLLLHSAPAQAPLARPLPPQEDPSPSSAIPVSNRSTAVTLSACSRVSPGNLRMGQAMDPATGQTQGLAPGMRRITQCGAVGRAPGMSRRRGSPCLGPQLPAHGKYSKVGGLSRCGMGKRSSLTTTAALGPGPQQHETGLARLISFAKRFFLELISQVSPLMWQKSEMDLSRRTILSQCCGFQAPRFLLPAGALAVRLQAVHILVTEAQAALASKGPTGHKSPGMIATRRRGLFTACQQRGAQGAQ
mmetsp:Transcript_25020/g.69825  ORF Transcript_25020/g.69825 Transcript_25020/m.69825 type:complete len:295 (+) Transcript_25020:1162-2046(+)